MPLRLDEAGFEEDSRASGVAVAAYTMRALERWRANLTDYDCVAIVLAVAAIGAERLLRIGFPEEYRSFAVPMERNLLNEVNISSIAHATGLNRETTRRKVNDLIERGLLTRSADGRVGFRPGVMQEGWVRELVRSQLREIAAVANQLIRIGVLAEQ